MKKALQVLRRMMQDAPHVKLRITPAPSGYAVYIECRCPKCGTNSEKMLMSSDSDITTALSAFTDLHAHTERTGVN